MSSANLSVTCLLFVSPMVGEYLLGSLPASMIALLPLMMAMYGAGAVLIREAARAAGRGWGSIALLGIAYGLFEEGFVTQSLFNPDYLHMRLLDFGYLPLIGTALPWAVFVVTIHVVWSISVPIALTESAFPAQRDRPWLGTAGRIGFALVFLVGCALIAVFTYRQVPFLATPAQLGVTGTLIIALCVAALKLPRPRATLAANAPHPAVLFLAGFLPGAAFMIASRRAEAAWHLGWPAVVALSLGIIAAVVSFVVATTRGGRWDERRRFALMAGAFVIYAWIGFETDVALHGRADLAGHSVIAALMCLLLVAVGIRASRAAAPA